MRQASRKICYWSTRLLSQDLNMCLICVSLTEFGIRRTELEYFVENAWQCNKINFPYVPSVLREQCVSWSAFFRYSTRNCCDYQSCPLWVRYWMKIYTEFNIANWLRMLIFAGWNICEFAFLKIDYLNYHCRVCENLIVSGM